MGGEGRTSEIAYVVVSGWFEGKVEDSEGVAGMGRSVCLVRPRADMLAWSS